MKIIVVNDARSQIQGTETLWDNLVDWTGAEFIGGDYSHLSSEVAKIECDLIIRNGSFFGPIESRAKQIALIQDIMETGPGRQMQESVISSADITIFNSGFTDSKYQVPKGGRVIPLPVDFSVFTPCNAMGCQQALSLPDGCVLWVGASSGPAGHIKGFDIFLQIVRCNPDIPFVAVLKDQAPEYAPPNMRCFVRLPHADLVKVIGACRVGLCTSRTESQHLAGIEMGACGLPLVVPPVGTYWNRKDWPGCEVTENTPAAYTQGIRSSIGKVTHMQEKVREYWMRDFDRAVIKLAWTKLISEVECSGR